MERGAVKFVWPISSGREGYATQTGTFQPQWTARMWYSRQWDMAPMPHAVFFNRGTAFHATSATGALGRRASHGCIRLSPGNAAKLYALVHRHGLESTKVVVHSAPKEPAVARRKTQVLRAGQCPPGRYQGQMADGSSPRGSAKCARQAGRPGASDTISRHRSCTWGALQARIGLTTRADDWPTGRPAGVVARSAVRQRMSA